MDPFKSYLFCAHFQALESSGKSIRDPADHHLDQDTPGRGSAGVAPKTRGLR
jgi:hypothetical protein